MEPHTRFTVGPRMAAPEWFARPLWSLGRAGIASAPRAQSNAIVPGRGFLFVVVELLPEVGSKNVIRKVVVVPRNLALLPNNPLGDLTLAEHALGMNLDQSQYLSASTKPFAAPTIQNRTPLLIDLKKVQQSGGRVYSSAEVIADLRRFAASNAEGTGSVDTLIRTIELTEGEVLIKGSERHGGGTPPHSARRISRPHNQYIRKSEQLFDSLKAREISRANFEGSLAGLEKSYGRARFVGRVGRVLTVFGAVLTVVELGHATRQSVDQRSLRPVNAELIRQTGGWGGAVAGAKIGFVAGAALGIKTGPGAIVTGAIGALIVGGIGYFGADWVADHVHAN